MFLKIFEEMFKSAIISMLLFFIRLFGITFGGIYIRNNGNLSVSSILKLYGVVAFIFWAIFNVSQTWNIIQTISDPDIYNNIFDQFPNSIYITIQCSVTINGILLSIYKLMINYYLNRHGYKIFEIIFKNFIMIKETKILIELYIIIIISFIITSTITILNILIIMKITDAIWISMSSWSYIMGFNYCWTLTAILWLIPRQEIFN